MSELHFVNGPLVGEGPVLFASEPTAASDGTDGLLRELTTHGKRLKILRDKRDRLRGELEETEREIRRTAADIAKLTTQLADQEPPPLPPPVAPENKHRRKR